MTRLVSVFSVMALAMSLACSTAAVAGPHHCGRWHHWVPGHTWHGHWVAGHCAPDKH
jgi:hypothetical protein